MGRSGGTPPIQVGDVLHGKYAVEIILGEGGMGVVMGGREIATGTKVAIKVMRSELLSSPEAVARFEREAKAACALRSEHVAKVLDAGRTPSGEPFIVMEYLLGSSLAGLVAQQKRLPAREVVDFALDVCDALVEAHALGIVHRDLKPDNVFVVERPGGERLAKVLDFGIAKVDNAALAGTALTTTGSMLGTPWYMAPEQLDTKRGVTPKTDVWALGATLYNALTGKTPFEAESFYELSVKVYAHEPTLITEHRPTLPQPLVDLVHACLQKDVARRLSLDELVKRLEAVRALDDGEITTEPDQKRLGGSNKRTELQLTKESVPEGTPTETKAIRPGALEADGVALPALGPAATSREYPSETMTAANPVRATTTAVTPAPMTTRIEATPMGPFTPATALLLTRPSAPPPAADASGRGSASNLAAFGPGMGTVSPYTTRVARVGRGPATPAGRALSMQIGVAFVIGLIAFGTVAGIVMRARPSADPAGADPTALAPVPVPMDPIAPPPSTPAAAPVAAPPTEVTAAPDPTPASPPSVATPAAPPSAATSAPIASVSRPPPTVIRKVTPPPSTAAPKSTQTKQGGALTHER